MTDAERSEVRRKLQSIRRLLTDVAIIVREWEVLLNVHSDEVLWDSGDIGEQRVGLPDVHGKKVA